MFKIKSFVFKRNVKDAKTTYKNLEINRNFQINYYMYNTSLQLRRLKSCFFIKMIPEKIALFLVNRKYKRGK